MTALPPEVAYGRVVGRWLFAIADTAADPDELPEVQVPTGTVTFTRLDLNTTMLDTLQNDGTYVGITRKAVTAKLNAEGELALEHSTSRGVMLITGHYNVSASIAEVTWPSFDIEVTTAHTNESPLDLITWTPITATPTIQIVTSIETALRAEAAADRAEAAADRAEGAELTYDSLGDVDTTGLADGDAMVWGQASGKWVRVSLSSAYAAPTGTDDRLQVAGVDVEPEQVGAAPVLGADDNYVTNAEKTVIGNTSGTNTGDQDLSGLLTTADAPELIRDTMGSALVAGDNVTITPDDGEDTITISATGGAAEQPPLFGPIPKLITSWGAGGFSNVAPMGYGNISMLVYRIERAVTIDALIFRVATLDAAATATAVLYRGDDVTGIALTRMALTDSVALTTTGDYVMPVTPVALTPGIYWATVLADKTDVAKVAGKFVSLPLNYSTILNDQFGKNNTYPKVPCPNPPPSTMTFANNGIAGRSYMPHVLLSRSA